MTHTFEDKLGDGLGDTAVDSPPAKVLPLALGGLIVVALLGFYMGLNSGDHSTRLPGDTGSGELSGVDFSRAKVAVALKPEEIAPPPPPPAPKVEVETAVQEVAAPVAVTPAAPVVIVPAPAAATPPAGPPPNLEGLF